MTKPRRSITGSAIFAPGDELAALWTHNDPPRRFYVPNCDVDDPRYKGSMGRREVTVEAVSDENGEWYEFKAIYSWAYRIQHNLHTDDALILHARAAASDELNHCHGARGRSCGEYARVLWFLLPREKEMERERQEQAERKDQELREGIDE